MDCRQIVAPLDRGEARIPALVTLPSGRLLLFYDERPAPASGNGSDFNGLTMASDLPNPNRIRWVECTLPAEDENASKWSTPRDLPPALPAITSDACVGIDGDGLLHLACASTQGRVGYMDSMVNAFRRFLRGGAARRTCRRVILRMSCTLARGLMHSSQPRARL